jgi:hypothetical protein
VEPSGEAAGAFDPAGETRQPVKDTLRAAADHLGVEPNSFVHARVDGVHRGGSFHLLGLELVAQYLNLDAREWAVGRCADRVVTALAAE